MLLVVAVCALFAAVPVMAQTSAAEFRKFLTDKAAFADQDLEILDKGEIVIKMLPVADKQEIAVFGIVRVNVPGELGLSAFAESLSQRKDSSFKGGGKFSSPPVAADLKDLKNEDRDFQEMQKCVVGKCDLNLSAEMIRRLQAEVDRLYGLFVDHVATMRGLDATAVRATEAGLYFGPNAISVGLAGKSFTPHSSRAG